MKKPEGKLQEFVTRLHQAAGGNLQSVVLYGSAARDEFNEQYSDVNLLLVLQDLGAASMAAIGPVVNWWTKEERFSPPLLMTANEVRESADVFAIEMLDIRNLHRVLFGEDLFSSMEIPMNLHRLEVEHELRTTMLRLRQHLLLHGGEPAELKAVLGKSISSVVTLVRHALIALEDSPPAEKPELLRHAAEVFGFDVRPLESVLQFRQDPLHPVDVAETYHAYLAAIGRIAHELDARAPKRQWRKMSHSV